MVLAAPGHIGTVYCHRDCMRTVEAGPYTQSSPWRRMLRDWRQLRRLVSMTVDYFTVGARVRRAYREKIARGEKFWLDREPPFV